MEQAARKLNPNHVSQPFEFVFTQLPAGCTMVPPQQYQMTPQFQQVPTQIGATGWDNQSHRSEMTRGSNTPSYQAHSQIQTQPPSQHYHPRFRTPFQGQPHGRHQFFQTFRPMQDSSIPGVGHIFIGQLHNQILPAEQDNVVYMDSGSTVRTARNRHLFHSIQESQRPIKMATNAGESILKLDGMTPIGVAYYNEVGIANINSLGMVVDECKASKDGSYVWMDSRVDDAIHHVTPTGDIRYGRTSNGLYGIEMYADNEVCFLETVEGNLEGMTKRQAIGATKAESMRVNFCLPPNYDMTNAVRAGLIQQLSGYSQRLSERNQSFWKERSRRQRKVLSSASSTGD